MNPALQPILSPPPPSLHTVMYVLSWAWPLPFTLHSSFTPSPWVPWHPAICPLTDASFPYPPCVFCPSFIPTLMHQFSMPAPGLSTAIVSTESISSR